MPHIGRPSCRIGPTSKTLLFEKPKLGQLPGEIAVELEALMTQSHLTPHPGEELGS